MKRALNLLLVSATMALPSAAWAFKLSPMIASFAPSGNSATQNFQLENTGSEKIAVQIEPFHRFTDLDGKETRTPTDEFTVYPQQVTLAPREKHTIKVTWTGNRQPDRELNYRLVVSELPVGAGSGGKQNQVKFLTQYVASMYVTPADSQPKLSVESFKVLSDGRGELVLKNSGPAHRMLKGLKILLKAGKKLGPKSTPKNPRSFRAKIFSRCRRVGFICRCRSRR